MVFPGLTDEGGDVYDVTEKLNQAEFALKQGDNEGARHFLAGIGDHLRNTPDLRTRYYLRERYHAIAVRVGIEAV